MRPILMWTVVAIAGCSTQSSRGTPAEADAGTGEDAAASTCTEAGQSFCEGTTHVSCEIEGGLLGPRRTDCALSGEACTNEGCRACVPETIGCHEGDAATCLADGSGWDVTEACDLAAGEGCVDGQCRDLCDVAVEDRSYEGCEFYPVDLDTSGGYAVDFGVIVSNPNPFPTTVRILRNDAAYGEAPNTVAVEEALVPGGDLEPFILPRRRIDQTGEGEDALEVHSAVTSRAYRIVAEHPVIAYQFNPLQKADVFSNDASLLLPVSAWDTRYTVVGWPQSLTTRGTVKQRGDVDYRSTLTIVGASAAARVEVTFGPLVGRVVGLPGEEDYESGDVVNVDLGPHDVLNLETDAFNADFSGTLVESDAPVGVYTGSEGADVPFYDDVSDRLCCADHVEGQLPPDRSLGTRFVLARSLSRSRAINQAVVDPYLLLPEANEPEWARIVAVAEGATTVTTTLPPPFDEIVLAQGEVATLRLDRDAIVEADRPVSVIQLLASQFALGLPTEYPGGDPAMIVVPPVDQYRDDYVFLTPATYGFDAITVIAPPDATVLLDREPLPDSCEKAPADGIERAPGEPPPELVVYRCALSAPVIAGDYSVQTGVQRDGVHRIVSSEPVGVLVSGFDLFVSYAYAAGMDLELLR